MSRRISRFPGRIALGAFSDFARLRRRFPCPKAQGAAYERAARRILNRIAPLFEGVECIRIHGDGHRQNAIDRPGEGLFLIDFDDLALGPPIQDLWMFLPGRLTDTLAAPLPF